MVASVDQHVLTTRSIETPCGHANKRPHSCTSSWPLPVVPQTIAWHSCVQSVWDAHNVASFLFTTFVIRRLCNVYTHVHVVSHAPCSTVHFLLIINYYYYYYYYY